MSEPVKMVCDDGHEMPMDRCPHCKCPRVIGYVCSGCEAKGYRDSAKEVRAQMALLSVALAKWER
jgi:uncharacterized Zn finger protein (UPF0148 family)